MSELMVAVVVFFSGLVSFATALVGYFKVWKPLKGGNGNSKHLTLVQLLNQQEERIERLEGEVKKCHEIRLRLEKDKNELMDENRELRKDLSRLKDQ